MPPKKKETDPVGEATELLAPVALLLFILVVIAWAIPKINDAIPIDVWSFGAGTIIAGLGVLAIAWNKYA